MRRLSAALIFLLVFSALLCLAAPAFLEADTVRTMIDGLDGLRMLSPEEAKTFPEPTGKVELTLGGRAASLRRGGPTPTSSPQSAETEGLRRRGGAAPRGRLYLLSLPKRRGRQWRRRFPGNVEYGIYAVRGDSCRFSRVLFTPQTVLCLTADSGELPGEGARGGRSGGLLRPRWSHRARTGACGGQRARQHQPPLPQEELPPAHPERAGRQAPSGHRRPAQRRRLDLEPPLRRHLEDTRTAWL